MMGKTTTVVIRWWAYSTVLFLASMPCSRCFVVVRFNHNLVRGQNQQQRYCVLSLSKRQRQEHFSDDGDESITGPTPSSFVYSPLLTWNHFENKTVSEIQKELVQLGLAWKQQQRQQRSVEEIQIGNVSIISNGISNRNLQRIDSVTQSNPLQFKSPLERVPGCVANVEIRTILQPPQTAFSDDTPLSYTVHLEGHADAMLSQGLVAVLANYIFLQQQEQRQGATTIERLLTMNPANVADELHLRQALSTGRNDGLANMMRLFQTQLQRLLLLEESMQKQQQEQPRLVATESVQLAELQTSSQQTRRRQLRNIVTTYWRRIIITPLQSMVTKTRRLLLPFRPQQQQRSPTVAVLLSGGVDSSVALALLRRQNYNCTAFYLKIWLEDELAHLGTCPWEDDYRTCQQVCEQLQVPLESISLQQEYKDKVMSYTLAEAQKGRTPNPDIMCNSRVKFGCFYDAIAERDFDYVASGHYAQVADVPQNTSGGRTTIDKGDETARPPRMLLRAPDPVKDQSYFLCALSQQQLQRVLFPIGHLQKSQVRQLALDFDLPNRNRPDSQGLCFLGKVKFEDFLQAYLGDEPGDVVDAASQEVLGHHRGVWYHTVGQRKGLGKVLDPLATSRGPWYVVAKDPLRKVVYCSNEYDEDIFTQARSEFYVEDLHWISGSLPTPLLEDDNTARFDMKIRHGPRLVQGTLELVDHDGNFVMNNGGELSLCTTTTTTTCGKIRLDHKDGGLAPGQFVAFYRDLECLGGGVISERHWAEFLSHQPTSSAAATQLLVASPVPSS